MQIKHKYSAIISAYSTGHSYESFIYLYAKHVRNNVLGFSVQIRMDQRHVVVRRNAISVRC